MPKMDVVAENPKMTAILGVLNEDDPKDIYAVAEELDTSYWTLYPYFRKLEDLGLITAGPFRRDKKKTFTRIPIDGTPKLHVAGADKPPVEIYKIAAGAAISIKEGTALGKAADSFPYMLLRLYALASSVQAGHDFDKVAYQSIRSDLVSLRNRMEIMTGAVNEILAHPVMSGNRTDLIDILMGDPNSPLTRETIQRILRECDVQKESD